MPITFFHPRIHKPSFNKSIVICVVLWYNVIYDDYDRLIQLCDAIAGADGVMYIEDRMEDVKRRYGYFPKDKWDNKLALKEMFEKKMGRNIYEVVGKENTAACG